MEWETGQSEWQLAPDPHTIEPVWKVGGKTSPEPERWCMEGQTAEDVSVRTVHLACMLAIISKQSKLITVPNILLWSIPIPRIGMPACRETSHQTTQQAYMQ